jgi:methionyl aminopeptidase
VQKLIKTETDIQNMRSAGRIVAGALQEVAERMAPGVTTGDLDVRIGDYVRARGGISAFLGYQGFPRNACISVNNEVIHGVPGSRRLQFGDVVKVDVGVGYNGMIADGAWTYVVGGLRDANAQRLIDVTLTALGRALEQVRDGVKISALSAAVQDTVENAGFSVVREFVGHGVGKTLHEEPKIPNFRSDGTKGKLVAGMTVAIEPMVNAGGPRVNVRSDGWTVETADGSLSAHFEHTVLVTASGAEVLTRC